jgi:O-antigen/teichoic acid export membrane protein
VLNNPNQKPKTLQARILSGSVILLSGSGLATAINFAYNIAVARFLGPKGFGNATAVYTLLTLISAVTLSFQIVSAKIVAQQKSPEAKSAGYRGFHQGAWICGTLASLFLLLFQRAISNYLNLPGPLLVILIAIGVAFYVPLGSRRGYLQGAYGFRSLATNLVLEGAVRLGGSLLLILLGYGVPGVIAANSAAIAVAYFAIRPRLASRIPNPLHMGAAFREGLQAMVFFSGQVLINNCDIVLVKHFFLPEAAGLYAAVAMVGRVIFSFSQAVVNSMFPLVAGTREEERKDLTVIATSLLLVLGIGSALALGLRLTPAWMWTTFFGSKFAIAGEHGLPYLLALYAITTVIYSLSAVIITYEMSYKIANTSWVQLAFSGVVIAGICLFHSSLRQVILVQLVLMIILLFLVALPFLYSLLVNSDKTPLVEGLLPIRLIRSVPEDEVIAEFLKSDFHSPAFRKYQGMLHDIVMSPNLNNPGENATRRALFSVRHLALWNELPAGTKWYEVEVRDADLGLIHVFPRAQWRKIAGGNFSILKIVECLDSRKHAMDSRFLSKISEIRERLIHDDTNIGPVVLIGINEKEPLTILDGNHRLVAAMTASPNRVNKLRFLCGLSPQMSACCWYNTNIMTLLHYGRNVLKNAVRRPKSELARLLQGAG